MNVTIEVMSKLCAYKMLLVDYLCTGLAYVGFATEKELNQAIGRNKNFIGGKRIFLKKADKETVEETVVDEKPRPWEIKQVP